MDELTKQQEHRIVDLCALILSDPATWPNSTDRLLVAIDREATMSGVWSGDEVLIALRQVIDARLERHRYEWHEGLTADDLNWLLRLTDRAKTGDDNVR